MREVNPEEKALYIETAKCLKGSDRRIFMARTLKVLGRGGLKYAEKELRWSRETITKGRHELRTGIRIIDNYSGRGRKKTEERLPRLLDDIKEIAESAAQTDPTFQTTRLFTRLSAKEVRYQLIEQKGYTDEELPSVEAIRVRLNQLGFCLRKVQKSKPKKKIPETDEIFDHLKKTHENQSGDETVLRISMDAKDKIKVGCFSRGGKSRVEVQALDHDFGPDALVTPYGLFLPESNETYIYLTKSFASSDFIVDCLLDFWNHYQYRFSRVKKLILNLDNGGENSSNRTQFIKRIIEFVDQTEIEIELAHYPPYHSKYNPVERVWGVLEQHWNGSLLDSVETVIKFIKTMTYKGLHPMVKLVQRVYKTGVKLTQKTMKQLEQRLERLPGLEKWSVKIPCQS
jgi:hypothetical protein